MDQPEPNGRQQQPNAAATCTHRYLRWACLGVSVALFGPFLLLIGVLRALKWLFPPRLFASFMIRIFDYVHKKISENSPHSDRDSTESQNIARVPSSESNPLMINYLIENLNGGFNSITNDDVIRHFSSTELNQWNLLTRTNYRWNHTGCSVTALWLIGFIVRHLIILPVRAIFAFSSTVWLFITIFITSSLPEGAFKRYFYQKTQILGINLFMCSICYSRVHDYEKNKPKNGSICVVNHTSPLDALILCKKQLFALTGQKFSDVSRHYQKMLAMCGDHLWFERSKIADRKYVVQKMEEHVRDGTKYPILIFPEGTCISNEAVLLFNKGTFEVPGAIIYPVAIKYDSRFADPFWNSSIFSLIHFILRIATSWGLVCDIYYMPPQSKQDDETAIEFAKRVKKMITDKGNFLDLDWDGQLKRRPPKPDIKNALQLDLTKRIVSSNLNPEMPLDPPANDLDGMDKESKASPQT